MSYNRRTIVGDALYAYATNVGCRETEVAAALRTRTNELPESVMQISPLQAAFLQTVVAAIGAKRCIEVGVFTGYSSLAIASALPEDGELIACDINEEWTAIAREFWDRAGVGDRVILRLAPGIETLDALIAEGQAGQFDFCFLDAIKVEYPEYYERCLVLLRPGGVIAVDNVLWGGSVIDDSDESESTVAIRAFNAARLDDSRVDLSMVPIGDGVTLLRKR